MSRALVLLAAAVAAAIGAVVLLREPGAGSARAGVAGALAPDGTTPAPRTEVGELASARLEAVPVGQGGGAAGRGTATPVAVAPIEGTSSLTVRAVDGATGTAVAAYFVRAMPGAVFAQGRAGEALLEGLAPGPTTLEVQGPEHEAVVHTLELPSDRPLILRLPQRPGLRGAVRFADARPAPDVVLRLVSQAAAATESVNPLPPDAVNQTPTPPGDGAEATLAKTDADGRYRFAPLAPGRYRVTVEHLGRVVAEVGPFDVRAGLVEVPDVRLEAGGRLELEVMDGLGRARTEALVVLVTPEGAALRRYTDHEGKLTLEPLPSGRYTVVLPAQAGLPEQRRELELSGGLHRESLRAEGAAVPARPPAPDGGNR